MRKLGVNQQDCLRAIREYGYWIPDHSGWIWDTTSNTTKILESLVKRGLVTKRMVLEHPKFGHRFRKPVVCYEPAEKDCP